MNNYIRPLTILGLVLLSMGVTTSAWPAIPKPAGKVTQVAGKATLHRIGLKDIMPVHFRDDVFLRDKISTKEQSFVRVLLGGKALVTVRELSIFTITEEKDHAIIDMLSGIMTLSVARKRMKPGEYIEIRTPHAIAAVRGTIAVTEVFDTTTFSLISGDMGVGPPGTQLVDLLTLPAGTQVQANDQGVGTPQDMPPEVQKQKSKLAEAPDKPDESPVEEQVAEDQGTQATMLAEALAPDSNTDGEGDGGLQTETDPEGDPTSSPQSPTDIPIIPTEGGGVQELLNPVQPVLDRLLIENQTLAVTLGSPVFPDAPFFPLSDTFNLLGQTVAVEINNSTVTGSGNTLLDHGAIIFLSPGANVSLEGPVLNIFNSTLGTVSNPLTTLLGLNGSILSSSYTGSLLTVDPSTFVGTNLVSIINGGSLSTAGTLFTGIDSIFTNQAGGLAAIFVEGGSSLSIGGPYLDLQNSTLDFGDFPVMAIFGGSTVENTAGPAIRMNNSTLLASMLVLFDNTGITLRINGSLMDLQNNSTVTIQVLGEGDADTINLTRNLNVPWVTMNNSTLNLTLFDGDNPYENSLVPIFAGEQSLGNPNVQQGTGLLAINSTLSLAGPLNVLGGENSGLTLEATLPINQLTGTTLTLLSGVPALILIEGPNTGAPGSNAPVTVHSSLLAAVNSSVTTPMNLLEVDNPFISQTANPVLDLNNTTVTAGTNIVLVSGTMTLAGQLLNDNNTTLSLTPNLTAGWSLLRGNGATISSTFGGALIEFNNTNFETQIFDVVSLFGGGSLTLSSGSLFLANNSTIKVDDSVFFSSGATVQAGGAMPFIHLTGTTTVTNDDGFPLLVDIDGGSVTVDDTLVRLEGTVNATTTQEAIGLSLATVVIGQHAVEVTENATLTVGKELLEMNGGSLNVGGAVLHISESGRVTSTNANDLVLLVNGTVSLATDDGTSIFDFTGINTAQETVNPGTPHEAILTVGTDTPYVSQGGSLLEAENTTLTTDRIVKIDTALLVATAPLVNLLNSTVNATPPDATSGVIDLSFRAKVMDTMPILAMDNSIMNVFSGSFLSLGNQTILSLGGDFISLINGSVLNINSMNGFLVYASGNSAFIVNGALINFGGTAGNAVNVQNALFSQTINGVAFSFINGAVPGQVTVNGTPIQNLGLGSVNLPNNGSLIQVDGPNATVDIQGI